MEAVVDVCVCVHARVRLCILVPLLSYNSLKALPRQRIVIVASFCPHVVLEETSYKFL